MGKRVDFTISAHARRRLSQRRITLAQIRRALEHPDRVETDRVDRDLSHAIMRFFRRAGSSVLLRVVYNHTVAPPRIVTAFFDRRLKHKR